MNEQIELDRLLTAWLTADAPIREPEPLLDRVLTRTARTRRRAAWRIPERWFPVSTITTRVEGVSRFPWRTVGVIALLAIALAVGALVIAGRAKPVPAPFGPAHNGRIVYSVDGDILAVDAPGRAPSTIVGGPTQDSGPLFSPDGQRFVFVRGVMASSSAELWTAGTDGSDLRLLAATPAIGWAEWSPRANAIAVSLDGDRSVIRMVDAVGGGSTDIRTGLMVAENMVFRPSDGQQMTFRGQAGDGTWGLYLINQDGSNMLRLDLDPGFQDDAFYAENSDYYFGSPSWSPDGTKLMYSTLEPDPTSPEGPGYRIHVADVSATGVVTGERTLEFDRSADDEWDAAWLPQGDAIIFQTVEGIAHRLMVVGLAPGSTPRDLGLTDTEGISYILSPDGRQVMSSTKVGAHERTFSVTDLVTLETTTLTLAGDDWSWQRTAQ